MTNKYPISVVAEIDSELHESLLKFLDRHPYWDVNKLFNASLSLFMLQNGSGENAIDAEDYRICSKIYLDSIFVQTQFCSEPQQLNIHPHCLNN